MEINNLFSPFEDEYLTRFEKAIAKGFAEGQSKVMANNLAKKAGEEIARGVSRVLAENLPIYRYIESSLSLGAERAVEKGIAKGKIIAVASLGRSGYPNIKLDDGTMVKEEEMAELAQTLNRLF